MDYSLGDKLRTYRPPLFKVVINFFLVALGMLAAVILIADDALAFVGIGLLFIMLLILLWLVLAQVGRSVTLYENGVENRTILKKTHYLYAALDAYRIDAIRTQYDTSVRLRGVRLYVGDAVVMNLGPALGDVHGILHEVEAGFKRHVLPILQARVARGETITFARLLPNTRVYTEMFVLRVSKMGLEFNDQPIVPWADVIDLEENRTRYLGTIRVLHSGAHKIEFRVYDSRGSRLALELMRAVLKDYRENQETSR